MGDFARLRNISVATRQNALHVADNQSNISILRTDLTATTDSIVSLVHATTNQHVAALQIALQTTNETVADNQSNVSLLQTDLAATTASIASLVHTTTNQSIAELQIALQTTNETVADNQANVSLLQTDLAATNASIATWVHTTSNQSIIELQTALQTTNETVATLTAMLTAAADSNNRARNDTSRWVGFVDKRVEYLKSEMYVKANAPPAKLDEKLYLLFSMKTRELVTTNGLDALLLGIAGPPYAGAMGNSDIALTHYALSLWVVDEFIKNDIDTDWLPPFLFESNVLDQGIHTIKLSIEMHTSAKLKAETIEWKSRLVVDSSSINVYLSYSLNDLYNVQESDVAVLSI